MAQPLSAGAFRVLHAIVTISRRENRAVTLDDLVGLESRVSLLNRLVVLRDRWLIVIDGQRIRPRATGVSMVQRGPYRFSG